MVLLVLLLLHTVSAAVASQVKKYSITHIGNSRMKRCITLTDKHPVPIPGSIMQQSTSRNIDYTERNNDGSDTAMAATDSVMAIAKIAATPVAA